MSCENKNPCNFSLKLEYSLILQLFLTSDNQIQMKLNKAFLNISNFSFKTNKKYILFFYLPGYSSIQTAYMLNFWYTSDFRVTS